MSEYTIEGLLIGLGCSEKELFFTIQMDTIGPQFNRVWRRAGGKQVRLTIERLANTEDDDDVGSEIS